MSWDGGWGVCCCLIPNDPQHIQYILHTIILTPEGDVASSTHIKGSWVGLSEGDGNCSEISGEPNITSLIDVQFEHMVHILMFYVHSIGM